MQEAEVPAPRGLCGLPGASRRIGALRGLCAGIAEDPAAEGTFKTEMK